MRDRPVSEPTPDKREDTLLKRYGLLPAADVLRKHQAAAIGFALQSESRPESRSRIGGRPRVPVDFEWPANRGRRLDFLLQIDLAELRGIPNSDPLPADGLLTFFYDLDDQPWGYDPADLAGFRVFHFTSLDLIEADSPNPDFSLPPRSLTFFPVITLPHSGSRAYDRLERELGSEMADRYAEFAQEFEQQQYPEGAGLHRLLGHSTNIQGDMQLEAQLVANGLYCGDPSGYNDPRAAALEPGADDWALLLQLDSDDRGGFMWGDVGMLYYWIPSSDLRTHAFERAWMTMQCC